MKITIKELKPEQKKANIFTASYKLFRSLFKFAFLQRNFNGKTKK